METTLCTYMYSNTDDNTNTAVMGMSDHPLQRLPSHFTLFSVQ